MKEGSTVMTYTLPSNIDKGSFFGSTEPSLHLVDRYRNPRSLYDSGVFLLPAYSLLRLITRHDIAALS